MILGLDDIIGGRVMLDILIWLGLTCIFYLVGYVVALNVVDDLTKNNWIKIPIMWGLAFVTSGLMSIFHYNPLVLFFIMFVANFFRLKNLTVLENKKHKNLKSNKFIFYIASYGYIFLLLAITHYINFINNL